MTASFVASSRSFMQLWRLELWRRSLRPWVGSHAMIFSASWCLDPKRLLQSDFTTEFRISSAANFGVKLVRPGFDPAAELPALSPARRRHGGCSSPLRSSDVIGGNRRAARASARGTGRTAYTKDVGRTVRSACHKTLVVGLTAGGCQDGQPTSRSHLKTYKVPTRVVVACNL